MSYYDIYFSYFLAKYNVKDNYIKFCKLLLAREPALFSYLLPHMQYQISLLHEAIRRLLILCRHSKHYTQQQLSAASGFSRQFISQLECGKRHPSLETLCQFAEPLDTNISSLAADLDKIYLMLLQKQHMEQASIAADKARSGLDYIQKTRNPYRY